MILRMPHATIRVRVHPRARADALAAMREDVVVVRVMAPPLDGRANDAACRLLAQVLDVRPTCVTITRGHHARDKVVTVDGISQTDADAAIRSALERPPPK